MSDVVKEWDRLPKHHDAGVLAFKVGDALRNETVHLRARVRELEEGLREIDTAPDPDHWVPQFQHVRDIARALLKARTDG